MKPHRLLPLLVLVFSAFMLSCDSGQQTVTAPDDLQPQFAKPDPGEFCDSHPDHPKCTDDPGDPSGEWIAFTGDLVGGEMVEGCCPNRGPFPAYTMTLAEPPFPTGIAGTHDGHIFMNSWAPAPNRKDEGGYIVQFWWGEETEDYYFMEITGGDVLYNKRTKFLEVTFTNEVMTIWYNHEILQTVNVSFVLTRDPSG
jgi:hypothetical protein